MAKFYHGTSGVATEIPELVPGMMKFCRRNGGIDEILSPECWIGGILLLNGGINCRLDGFDAKTMEFGRRNGEIVAEMAEC